MEEVRGSSPLVRTTKKQPPYAVVFFAVPHYGFVSALLINNTKQLNNLFKRTRHPRNGDFRSVLRVEAKATVSCRALLPTKRAKRRFRRV